jgi:hypothetical protein
VTFPNTGPGGSRRPRTLNARLCDVDGEQDRATSQAPSAPAKTYVGFSWIGNEPGIRLRVSAESPGEARAVVEAEFGSGHVISLWNEDDASKPR